MKLKSIHITTGLVCAAAIALSSCASISKDECLAGNWADLGYRDGLNGVERQRLTEYANTCSEHGVSVGRDDYLKSFESGLKLYCVYDKGYALGRNGSSYNSVCEGPSSDGFRAGYNDGRTEHSIATRHASLIDDLEEIDEEIDNVRDQLRDPELTDNQYRNLQLSRDSLEDERQEIRRALIDFEAEYGIEPGRY